LFCKGFLNTDKLKMDDSFSNILLLFAAEPAAELESWLSVALKISAVIVLVFINGFFVAAEFAFVGVRRSRVEALAEEGSKSAKRLLNLLDNLNAYLSASQLGITLASLGLGALGEPVVEAMLGGALNGLPESVRHFISYGIAFFIITSLHIVLGEQAPKLVGLAIAEKVAMATALPMQMQERCRIICAKPGPTKARTSRSQSSVLSLRTITISRSRRSGRKPGRWPAGRMIFPKSAIIMSIRSPASPI
jgi:hypothetical protein